jgi:hypothetical protein
MKKLLTGLGLIALASLLSLAHGCVSAGWRITAGVTHASDTTGRQLAQLAQSKVTAKRSGLSADELRVCREWKGHLENWQQFGRPAVRTGVATSASILRVCDPTAKGKCDWAGGLKPAGCGIWQTLRAWGHHLPDGGQSTIASLSSWLDTKMCPFPARSVGGTVGTVLTIGMEVFKWLTEVLGAPTDKLKAQIAAWLKRAQADETEPVLQALKERCP